MAAPQIAEPQFLLEKKKVPYIEKDVATDSAARDEMKAGSGKTELPQLSWTTSPKRIAASSRSPSSTSTTTRRPAKHGVRGIPTLMLFKNGNVEAAKVGALSKSQLEAFLDANL
jgi:Thioredoxin